jgi:putative ABC transport system permease protein
MGAWGRRLAEVFRPGRADLEIAEEMQAHVDALVDRYIAAGLSDSEARRRARLELGDVTRAREDVADGRTGAALARLAREARTAGRILVRAPGLTALSTATMAVGIAASATLIALVQAVILRPLPYPEADRLVRIVDTNVQAGVERAGITTGNLFEWRQRTQAFSQLAGAYTMGRTISTDGEALVVQSAQVTADFFTLAGVAPVLGRTFTAEESERASFSSAAAPTGPDPVAVVSHDLWQTRFGADPAIVGRTLTMERRPFRVVGVMPPGFALPERDVQVWIPWRIAADDPKDQHYVVGFGRLAAGRSIDDGLQELVRAAADLAAAFPATNAGWSVRVIPLHDETVGRAAGVLWLLAGAVVLLLLVACANVALLTLIRGLDRAADGAVRLAIGATPTRLLREYLMESVLLAAAGGVLGVGLAAAAVRLLPGLVPDLPRVDEVHLDAVSLVALATMTATATLLTGLPQAWRRTRVAPAAILTDTSVRTTSGTAHGLRDVMAVAQVAMALVLLVGAGLVVRSVRTLSTVDSGFDPRGVLVAPIFLDSTGYRGGDPVRTYYRSLFERLRQVPGVTAVGGATTVPTSPLGPDFERPVWPAEAAEDPSSRVPAWVRMATTGYFDAIGARVLAGRPFDDRDRPASPAVVMVSRGLARRLWPDQDPLGKQLVVDYSTAGTAPYEVIGVVGDTRFRGPRSEPAPEIYLAHAQRPYLVLNVVVRTAGDPAALAPAVQAALREIDPQKPAHGLYPLRELLDATYVRDRQTMAVLLVFAAAATALAVLSVYGVLSHRVRERRREIGIRMAMGAAAPGLVAWVVGAGARVVGLGLGAGLAGAWAASAAIAGVLYGVSPTDALTTTAAAAFLLVVAIVAMLPPALRATRIDPVAILRRG